VAASIPVPESQSAPNPNLGLLSLVIILAEELASTEEDRRREGRRIKWRDREDGDRKVKYAQVLFITAEISSVLTAAIDGIHPDRSILAVASRSPMRGQCRGAKCLGYSTDGRKG
jgi:hypothetical protein